MAMVKSIASNLKCVFHIQDYLEKNNRAIARDFLNFPTDRDHTRNWSYFFDETRAEYGNDRQWGGKDPVTYQHFIVSPDPRDEVDLDTLRAFVTEWANDLFGGEEGSLGTFEVAIVYHDDNNRGIPHAHVVVNNTNLETGNKLHTSRKESKYLATHLQDLALKYGLTAFENDGPGIVPCERVAGFGISEADCDIDGHICLLKNIGAEAPKFLLLSGSSALRGGRILSGRSGVLSRVGSRSFALGGCRRRFLNLFFYEVASAKNVFEVGLELNAFRSLDVFEVDCFADFQVGDVNFDHFRQVAGTAFYADFVFVYFYDAVLVLNAVRFAKEM